MKNQQVVDVENATDAEALQEAHQRTEQLRTDPRGLRHPETYRLPLHPATRARVPEPTSWFSVMVPQMALSNMADFGAPEIRSGMSAGGSTKVF